MARMPARPDLDWSDPAGPRALAFDDLYFSRAGGLQETRAVFLAGCGLPEGWAGRDRFAILELGFGSGLNALATHAAWRETRQPGAVLHFVSCEAFPLTRDEAARVLAPYSELAPHAARLLARWPVRAFGSQRIWLDDGFALIVLIGDARESLARIEGTFDAFFLDGFAPARNPELWDQEVMSELARLAAPGARAATYSVAGGVRRTLEGAGFITQKKPGFAGKRERLEAMAPRAPRAHGNLYRYAPPVFGRLAIGGGGIAGACVARALARRGVRTTIYDEGGLGAGASGSPAALLMPRLDRDDLAPSRLYRAAYLEALRLYEEIGALDAIGVQERPADARDAELLGDLARDPPLPEDFLTPCGDGLLHPRAGLVRPSAALPALTADADVVRARIVRLERSAAHWTLVGEDGARFETDAVVLCSGAGLGAFEQTRWLPLEYSRGQIDWGDIERGRLERAIASGAYAAPLDGGVLFGATFDRIEPGAYVEADADSTARNLAALRLLAPEMTVRVTGSRAAVRVSANDRMPVVGLAPAAREWAERFASLKDGRAPADMAEPPPAHDGLYVLGGLGARGFLLAPVCAERLASEMCGEPQALDRGVIEASHPARFLVRALKRGQSLAY